ncbi:MAG: magnesium transporter [Deltaproteobacteria bacterium]|nr:magnesium transporter [Deltaproteobacteria bacterium]
MKSLDNHESPIWFLTEILNRRVVDSEGLVLGRVLDLTANAHEADPLVTGMLLSNKIKERSFLPWVCVEKISREAVVVKSGTQAQLTKETPGPDQIFLNKNLLDKQIVDTSGAKVIRVNDLQLRPRNGDLLLYKVDVGFRGLMRRVGLLAPMEKMLKWIFDYSLTDNLIAWRLVQTVGSADILRLKLSQSKLSRLHPADLAEIIEDLGLPERDRFFKALDIDVAADVLEESDPKIQVSLIQNLSLEQASDVLEQMSPSKATDLLQELEEPQAQTLLQEMEPEIAEDIRGLLVHDEETAGGLMTTSFFSQPPETTASRALELLRQQAEDLDVVYYVYVEDANGLLLGVASLRDLLTASPETTLESIMMTRVVSTTLEADKDQITELFVKYGLRAVPVVDEQGRIHGAIRFKSLLEMVAPHLEH